MKTNFPRFSFKIVVLTSEPEYDERIGMNEKFKNVLSMFVSSMFFWEFGYAQYFLTILTYMIDFILTNHIVASLHKISTFSHSQTK